MDQLPQSKKNFSLILTVIIFGLLIVLVLLLINKKNSSPSEENSTINIQAEISPQPTEVLSASYFNLLSNKTPVKSGSNFELIVEADSDSKIITGFDLLFVYDKTAFDFIKIESLDKDYKVFNYKAPTHLSITGTRDLSAKVQMPFAKVNLIKFTFKAKSTGSYKFALKPNMGKEVTTMIDLNTKKITPIVNEIEVQVK